MTDAQLRFWSKVLIPDDPDACWEWQANRMPRGYGRFWFCGKDDYAHRLSWIWENGDIPDEMLVCHRCDNPRCVRPSHLFIGTSADNQQDAKSKGRKGTQTWEFNSSAKLNIEQVRDMREMHRTGISQREISEAFSISKSQVQRIVASENWR